MQFDHLKRREFMALLGGATAAWSREVRAQRAQRVGRVGVLLGAAADDPQFQTWLGGFLQELAVLGWGIGRNVRIDTRWAPTPAELNRHAAELLAVNPDVILAHGASAVGPLTQVTRKVPIVFPVMVDPIGMGFVETLARPGGNVTGFMSWEYSLGGKWLELLKAIAPTVTKAAVFRDLETPAGTGQFSAVQSAAALLGVEVTAVNMRDAADIERTVEMYGRSTNGGLVVTAGPSAVRHRELIISTAARQKVPAVYYERYFAASGGLLSYGPDYIDEYRRAAGYVDRILKGEKPADLPVQVPTKYELVINMKTARALGLDLSPMLLTRADEVIE
jgi:putative ABC transport system substrate-binding protein